MWWLTALVHAYIGAGHKIVDQNGLCVLLLMHPLPAAWPHLESRMHTGFPSLSACNAASTEPIGDQAAWLPKQRTLGADFAVAVAADHATNCVCLKLKTLAARMRLLVAENDVLQMDL